MSLPSLKPCPCCAGKAQFVRVHFAGILRAQWRVFCTRCQLRQLRHSSRPIAAQYWNRRTGGAL